jgi:5-methylcytosine-specific restriction endonuclease McrA
LDDRPPIPADIRRRVLVEAGHRCAIPTCRHIEVDIHHIVAWAQRQAHEYDNLIALCPNGHRRADRGEIDRKALRLYKANLRFVHDKYSQVELDILFELNNLAANQGLQWPPFMLILLKRILESGLIHVEMPRNAAVMGGVTISPCTLTLTQKGRELIEDLEIAEL